MADGSLVTQACNLEATVCAFQACVQEADDITALALLDRLVPDINTLEDSDATWFCSRVLLLCLQSQSQSIQHIPSLPGVKSV